MSDTEMPRVFSHKIRKASCDHECCECRRNIPRREKYHYAKGCWDGHWGEYKTCIPCHELRTELERESEFAPFGSLSEWAAAAGFEFPPCR